jgi:hypothetical protein
MGLVLLDMIIQYSLDSSFQTGVSSVGNAGTSYKIQDANLEIPFADISNQCSEDHSQCQK